MVKVGDIVTIKSVQGLENRTGHRHIHLNEEMNYYAGETAKVDSIDDRDDSFTLKDVIGLYNGNQWYWDNTMTKKQKFFIKLGNGDFVNIKKEEDELFVTDNRVTSDVDTQFKIKKAKKIKKRFLKEFDNYNESDVKIVPVLTDADITVF